MKKEYTPEETAKYIAERNQKRNEERAARKPKLIWNSKTQGTYTGSLREQFLDVKPVELVEETESETTEA